MWPAQYRDRTALPAQVADGIGGLRRAREGAHKQYVSVVEDIANEILDAGIADEPDVMAKLFTPHADHLRHDARQIGVHHPVEKTFCGPLGDEIKDGNAEFSQRQLLLAVGVPRTKGQREQEFDGLPCSLPDTYRAAGLADPRRSVFN